MRKVPKNNTLPVYVINLSKRTERFKHIQSQFKNRNEFNVIITEACEDNNGAIGLWNSILKIINAAIVNNESIIIICEDDHEFTRHYSQAVLYKYINEAQEKDADILLGGVSWFRDAIQISKDVFWVEKFSGSQFTIIFKKFYEKILWSVFSETDAADYKISSLSDKKFIIYPFISMQKEFGYSDVTLKNNKAGFVERIFEESSERLRLLTSLSSFYKTI